MVWRLIGPSLTFLIMKQLLENEQLVPERRITPRSKFWNVPRCRRDYCHISLDWRGQIEKQRGQTEERDQHAAWKASMLLLQSGCCTASLSSNTAVEQDVLQSSQFKKMHSKFLSFITSFQKTLKLLMQMMMNSTFFCTLQHLKAKLLPEICWITWSIRGEKETPIGRVWQSSWERRWKTKRSE